MGSKPKPKSSPLITNNDTRGCIYWLVAGPLLRESLTRHSPLFFTLSLNFKFNYYYQIIFLIPLFLCYLYSYVMYT